MNDTLHIKVLYKPLYVLGPKMAIKDMLQKICARLLFHLSIQENVTYQ